MKILKAAICASMVVLLVFGGVALVILWMKAVELIMVYFGLSKLGGLFLGLSVPLFSLVFFASMGQPDL